MECPIYNRPARDTTRPDFDGESVKRGNCGDFERGRIGDARDLVRSVESSGTFSHSNLVARGDQQFAPYLQDREDGK